ncbi:MAG: F0F1 ATP synthase subunit gamma [Betaproteobacteria bacterium]|nr:F0F1 ATP synthase subunit gamma [Betaproteobacteria bacterium]NBT74988.1 F0F1 ATP synthase subunit gamma [Betaproteobacteria bacterium]NBY14278.1 F0F1 ATP synthase subunit gamma [Betaproteobacteria bacterium]NCA15719.1 F0F1 ATP synthase subunit gamma [Betaproteobacteria bacterium]NDF04474.1 F0F1 ATP synthase subunit gamma [Betaproteobacteria bacterium]
MPGSKEIRSKIKSVQNTRKITKAMEMVAASKMRKAQERMRSGRPYVETVRSICAHLSHATPEFVHPFMVSREVHRVGIIVVTTDKGLCGGLNTNILRAVLMKMKDWDTKKIPVQISVFGSKGFGFFNRMGGRVVSHADHLGDSPRLEDLIGPIKVQLDAFSAGEIDALYLASNDFVNTMKQEPIVRQLLPLSDDQLERVDPAFSWDYLYEPSSEVVLSDLLLRYIEAVIFQSVAENMACEQSARMVAMKAASDNAKSLIGELQLSYNKARQAAITKELSEIVGGAAAV